MRRILLLFLLTFVSVEENNHRLLAQWSNDPAVNTPICTESYNQLSPQVIQDGQGGWIIAWNDERYDVDRDIFAQRIDAFGYKRWAEEGVPVIICEKWQQLQGMVSDGSGGAIVVWTDTRADTCLEYYCEMDIYAQRIDSTGQQAWDPGGIPVCTAPGFQANPVITTDVEGGAIIAWMDGRIEIGDFRIYIQRIDNNGNILWDHYGVLVQPAELYQEFPEVIADGKGGAFVIWRENYLLFAKRFDKDRNSLWGKEGIRISYLPGLQKFPELATDSNGGVMIVWRNKELNYEIRAQRISAFGERLWGDEGVLVSKYADGSVTFPNMISDGHGGVIVGWAYSENDSIITRMQRITPHGYSFWGEEGITPGGVFLVSDSFGGATFLFSDYRAQRADSLGNLLWGNEGVDMTTSGVYGFSIAGDSNGGLVLIWYTFGHGWDIFGQYINGGGILGGISCEKGDVNADNAIDILDVVRVINMILKIGDTPTNLEICAADLNLDGEINVIDVLEIVNIILYPVNK